MSTFRGLAELGERFEKTKSKLRLTQYMADYIKGLSPDEIPQFIYLILGQVFPERANEKLNLSWGALKDVLNLYGDRYRAAFSEAEDVGEGVKRLYELKNIKSSPSLQIRDVYESLRTIASLRGKGSRGRKEEILKNLFSKCSGIEAKYLSKIVIGEMRHGVNEGIAQEAIAKAFSIPPEFIRKAYMLRGDLGEVAILAREGRLSDVKLKLFNPLKPMLAQTAKNISQAFDILKQRFALEYKYDGARVQIHKDGDIVRIFSRRLTDITDSLGEITQLVRENLRIDKGVVEGEVVAVDKDNRPLPFQYLMHRLTRKRRSQSLLKVQLYLFDCLFLENGVLLDTPYEERRDTLSEIRGDISLSRLIIPKDIEEAERFLKEAMDDGQEGVMAKSLEGSYTLGVRGKLWLKIKPVITLDLVILAADWGYGRRHNWLSNYHLGVYHKGRFLEVGKTFKGLSDKEFEYITQKLLSLKIDENSGTVYTKPRVVVEVAFNEIQKSHHYPSGLALRFARITRIREDKRPEDIITLDQLRNLYEKQFLKKGKI